MTILSKQCFYKQATSHEHPWSHGNVQTNITRGTDISTKRTNFTYREGESTIIDPLLLLVLNVRVMVYVILYYYYLRTTFSFNGYFVSLFICYTMFKSDLKKNLNHVTSRLMYQQSLFSSLASILFFFTMFYR